LYRLADVRREHSTSAIATVQGARPARSAPDRAAGDGLPRARADTPQIAPSRPAGFAYRSFAQMPIFHADLLGNKSLEFYRLDYGHAFCGKLFIYLLLCC
jgi:hypothetical protein